MRKSIPNDKIVPFRLKFFLFVGLSILIGVSSLAGKNTRGYLITKNGVQLTGMISEVFDNNKILFINDFGTPYKVHAALIRGFVVSKQGNPVFFASKFSGKNWYFMQLLHRGEGMNLYAAPAIEVQAPPMFFESQSRTRLIRSNSYYVELKGRLLIKVRRGNFKRSMRRLLKKEAPELAGKIGSKGYRYKNLESIIQQYNELIQKDRISL